jgi:uroporphyrinogen III methyltransferase / synthase
MKKPSVHQGICYLTGAGPGDLGLVTLRAREVVEQAEVVVYDYLCNPGILAWAPAGAEIIYAGKKAGDHTLSQDEITALIVDRTRAGKCVVRLKGGDPFVFGRGGEEAEALAKEGLAFEIIPGVSSVFAGPAYAGIPVTHRDHTSQVTIFTGHEDPSKPESALDYAALAKQTGTRIMLMGVERIGPITEALLKYGADPALPVALIRWATTGRQQTLRGRLDNIATLVAEANFAAPAVAIFGQVVNLRDTLNWFENRPLFGRRIVVTRTRQQAGALSSGLRALGADAWEIPTIRIEDPANIMEFGQLVQDSHGYDWIVFTSPNGVDAFFKLFYKLYDDARDIGAARIAVVGPATAARVRDFRLKVDLQPDDALAESLIKKFKADGSVENLRMLIIRPEKARDVLSRELTQAGAIVDEAIAYRTVPETNDITGGIDRFRTEGADVITFTSSSTVENFLALKVGLPANLKIASIGPITSKTIREAGLNVDIEARTHDVPGLIEAIRKFYVGK